jgi:carboxylate-amine ligase
VAEAEHRASVLDHRFGSGDPYRLGVEEEFMLLDPVTWDCTDRSDALLASVAEGPYAERIHSELMQSVLEITTPVCRSPAEAGEELRRLRAHVTEIARTEGCRFASAGTHPFSLFELQQITANDRYRALVEELQYIARSELIFGMHVHTSVDDADKAIAVTNALLPHLAEFLALSASSPFWRGEPTGLQSSRQMVFSAFPRSGVPPRFADYAEYADVIGQLERTGCIADYTRIWWDVRIHARLGTIELRICDAVTNVDDAVAITAYFQALVKHYCEQFESGRKLAGHHRILSVENKFLAARHGLAAPVMDLATGSSERVPVSELVRRALGDLEPHARELGSERELEGIAEILSRGNGADHQLRIWNANRDITAVVRDLSKMSEVDATRVS